MERTEKPEALPLISVIVPVYRVERFPDRCVESICAQTYRNLEIILVDDGSPDNCPAICDAWAERDERITVLHQENRGVSSARNAGMDAMKGAYWYSSGFLPLFCRGTALSNNKGRRHSFRFGEGENGSIEILCFQRAVQ